jgi:thioesterase domain-containing protein
VEELRRLPRERAHQVAIDLWRKYGLVRSHFSTSDLDAWRAIFTAGIKAYTTWNIPKHHLPHCLLIRATRQTGGYSAPETDLGWSELVGPSLRVVAISGEHHEVLRAPFVAETTHAAAEFLRSIN